MSPSFWSNSHMPEDLNILCHCHLMVNTFVHFNMVYKVLLKYLQTLPMVASLIMEQNFAATKQRYNTKQQT
jgi:hypothetical protein